MTALFESLSLTIIRDVFSLSNPTYWHFNQVGKPVLDNPTVLVLSSENLLVKWDMGFTIDWPENSHWLSMTL